ncbi:MAG: hypothetical protein AAF919_17780 [Pseudomonadota bacterium]
MSFASFLRPVLMSLCLLTAPAHGRDRTAILVFASYPGWDILDQIRVPQVTMQKVDSQAEAIAAYRSGAADMIAISHVDLLALMADDAPSSEAVILFPTSFSNGADFIVGPSGADATNLAGQRVGVPRVTVSHYLMMRELDTFSHENERPPVMVDLDPAEIPKALKEGRIDVAVMRAPAGMDLLDLPNMQRIFDSHAIERDIVDLVVMRRDRYLKETEVAEALSRAWFDTVENQGTSTDDGISRHMIETAEGAARMMQTGEFMFAMLRAMDFVKVQHRALDDTTSLNPFAVRFWSGATIGDPQHVQIEVRFDHLGEGAR